MKCGSFFKVWRKRNKEAVTKKIYDVNGSVVGEYVDTRDVPITNRYEYERRQLKW
jgi:hypothetical protein